MIRALVGWACLAMLAAPMLVRAESPAIYRRLKLDRMHERAPDFGLEGDGGHKQRLTDLRGKPLILHVWASWCTGCATELPKLARFAREGAKNGELFLPVSVDPAEKQAELRKLLAGAAAIAGDPIPYWRATTADEIKSYWAWGLPITYFIDAQGEIVARALGPRDWSQVPPSELASIFQNK